jgi:hypothetical protein
LDRDNTRYKIQIEFDLANILEFKWIFTSYLYPKIWILARNNRRIKLISASIICSENFIRRILNNLFADKIIRVGRASEFVFSYCITFKRT